MAVDKATLRHVDVAVDVAVAVDVDVGKHKGKGKGKGGEASKGMMATITITTAVRAGSMCSIRSTISLDRLSKGCCSG